jgi:hypothetical protein
MEPRSILSHRQIENDDLRIAAEVEPITDDHLRGALDQGEARRLKPPPASL